jgi:DNA-binding transcriptional MerR regulator
MKIKELEELLSISRSNIRFYEKQGLFSPQRKENNYRDYGPEDIAALKEIIVYRKLGFTIEEIAQIQNKELPFREGVTTAQERLEK